MTEMIPSVIVDMDGTLCDVSGIRHLVMHHPKDFAAFHAGSRQCPPHRSVVDELEAHHRAGRAIVVVTARMYQWQDATVEWLTEHLQLPYHGPFMRGDNDFRPDTEVKRDIHRILVDDHGFDIVHAIDDNPKIIALWEDLGIPVTVVPGWPEGFGEQAEGGAMMAGFQTLQGYTQAVETAADLDVCSPEGSNSEYERGIVELIAQGFLVNTGYDADESKEFVRREIANMRLRKGL